MRVIVITKLYLRKKISKIPIKHSNPKICYFTYLHLFDAFQWPHSIKFVKKWIFILLQYEHTFDITVADLLCLVTMNDCDLEHS